MFGSPWRSEWTCLSSLPPSASVSVSIVSQLRGATRSVRLRVARRARPVGGQDAAAPSPFTRSRGGESVGTLRTKTYVSESAAYANVLAQKVLPAPPPPGAPVDRRVETGTRNVPE